VIIGISERDVGGRNIKEMIVGGQAIAGHGEIPSKRESQYDREREDTHRKKDVILKRRGEGI